jgi:ATP-dependent DNA ligase
MAQRMIGYAALDAGRPYPFYLARPWQRPARDMQEILGPPNDWIVEWKFDGIRAQLVKRGESWRLWSRGEEHHSAAWRRYALMIPLISARQEPQFVPACRACPIASTVTQPALAAAAI